MKNSFLGNSLITALIITLVFVLSPICLRAQIESTDGEPVNWEPSARFNMAQSSMGAIAVGSSNYDESRFPAAAAINGDRAGYGWRAGAADGMMEH